MAGILHGGVPCHISHHNHSHGGNLLNHQHSHSDEAKFVPIDDNSRQAECKSAENINVQAAFLHVLGDFIQSIGVIIAAVIIKIYVSASNGFGFECILFISIFFDVFSPKRKLLIR